MNTLLSVEWWAAAGIRALKTFAQILATLIGANQVSIIELDWIGMLGIAATAAVLSLLTSLAGLPELDGVVEVPEVVYDEEGE